MVMFTMLMTACGVNDREKTLDNNDTGKTSDDIVGTWQFVKEIIMFDGNVVDEINTKDYEFQFIFREDGTAIEVDGDDVEMYDYIYSREMGKLIFMQDGAVEMSFYVTNLSSSELVCYTDEFTFKRESEIGKYIGSYRGFEIYEFEGGLFYKKDGEYYPCGQYSDNAFADNDTWCFKRIN